MKKLTKTETKVAKHIALGFIEKEIAVKLFVSTHTIHTHARNIRRKLNARNIADITRHYILSLDNPKKLLTALFFAFMQIGMMASGENFELRKPVSRTSGNRIVRVKNKQFI